MMLQPDMKRETLEFVCKRIRKARISLGKAEQKKGAEREIEGLNNKIEVLEYLTEIVMKEDGRQ